MLAISVDAPDDSRRLRDELALPYRLLSDVDRAVLGAYGLAHERGGPGGETIAVPAELLVSRDGTIAWRHVARRITDRADPAAALAAVEGLAP